ncbi:MAG TPA: thiamine diphosphokinase [Candidatus Caenarcaniphilales bacterium]|nr:thiamine diphosphokinase [Candidatus Caenarcaniphilales bacterium]
MPFVQSPTDMKALVVADGDVHPAVPVALHAPSGDTHARPLVVAADGGARKAELLGLLPDVVVGDMDSLAPETLAGLERRGVELQRHSPEKEASDTELAVQEALRRGATELVILGALGGTRFEHTLANVLLLTLPDLAGRNVALVDGPTTVRAIGSSGPDRLELDGQPGDLVSLLPLTAHVEGVTTTGLAYALSGETLEQGTSRGLSNLLDDQQATIATSIGRLAIVHTRRAEAVAGG